MLGTVPHSREEEGEGCLGPACFYPEGKSGTATDRLKPRNMASNKLGIARYLYESLLLFNVFNSRAGSLPLPADFL